MNIVIPSQVVQTPDPFTFWGVNAQGSVLKPQWPCSVVAGGGVKWASAADLLRCRNIVFPVSEIDIGASGLFRACGIHDVGPGFSLIPGSRYFLSPVDGEMIANDAPPAPNETVEIGYAISTALLVMK